MNGAIGGYFELELRSGERYHKDALCLNTARNCFEYILLARKYKKVYIPYDNIEDLDDVAEEVKEKLDIVPVKKVTDVLKDQALM